MRTRKAAAAPVADKENPVAAKEVQASSEKLAAELKKLHFQLESSAGVVEKSKQEVKDLRKERDVLQREAAEALTARNKAEDALAAAQREASAKNDANVTLVSQTEKLKQLRAEEESARRVAQGEVARLKHEVETIKQNEAQSVREVTALKDSLLSVHASLEREKKARQAAKVEAAQADLAAQARIREVVAERDAREIKARREQQESADTILRLRADLKAAAKEAVDRQRVAAEELGAKQGELEAVRLEAKKLKERLDASTSYIDAMKNKQTGAAAAHLAPVAVAAASAPVSENVAELQSLLKSVQQQNALLQGINESLKRKEADLAAQVAQLEKTVRDATTAHSDAEIKAEKARSEIKNLALGVDQLKQTQRVLEARAKKAEGELEATRTSQSSAVEGAVLAENVMAVECKKLRVELDRAVNMHEAAVNKLQLELQEAREERDGALDMLASQSLDAETELAKRSAALTNENAALKQSVAALEMRAAEATKRVNQLEEALASVSSSGSIAARASPVKKADGAGLVEANEKLKAELRATQGKLAVEVETMTALLEEEMMNHQTTQVQLRETEAKLVLQLQSVDELKSKLDRLAGDASEMVSNAKDASSADKAALASLQSQLQSQSETCASLKELVSAKDQKLETFRLRIEEFIASEQKAAVRHDEVRTRLDQLLVEERESKRVIQSLQDAKKKLDERLAELQVDRASESGALASRLAETSLRLQEAERALQSNGAALEKELALVASLQKRISALEGELVVSREALLRLEASSCSAVEDLKAQLASDANRLAGMRDEAIAEAGKKVSSLTADLESLRAQMRAASKAHKESRAQLEEQAASLSKELTDTRSSLREREAAADAAELKRQQAESAIVSITRRAEEAEAQCRQERQQLQLALQEADVSRTMAAEAELAAEQAQAAASTSRQTARDELLMQVDASKREAEEWQRKAEDADLRAQGYMAQMSASEQEWQKQRELLRSVVTSTDSKVQDVQRDAETRLLESNRLLFDARNALSDMKPKYEEAVQRAATLEGRLSSLEEEKTRCAVNWQIRLDEMEDTLCEAKQEAEQALQRAQAETERQVQALSQRAAQAEADASEARRLASAGESELSLVASHSQAELSEMTRRNDALRDDLAAKTDALERAVAQTACALSEMDQMSATLTTVRLHLEQSQLDAGEKTALLEQTRSEAERLGEQLRAAERMRVAAELEARDAFKALQHASAEKELALEERLRADEESIASLTKDLEVARREVDQAGKRGQDATSFSASLERELDKWKEQHRTLEMRLQAGTEDLAVLQKSARQSEDAAARAAKELNAEIARLNGALDASHTRAEKLDHQLLSLQTESAALTERAKGLEAAGKERAEEVQLLLEQLAEAEVKSEETDATLRRVRSERDEARLAKTELAAKAATLEKETTRLTSLLAATETDTGKARRELEEHLDATRAALAKEKDSAAELAAQVRTLESRLVRMEESGRSAEISRTKLQETLAREKSVLEEQLLQSKRQHDELSQRAALEREALTIDLKVLRLNATEAAQSLKERDQRLATLENEAMGARIALAEATDQLLSLRGVEQTLTAAQSRFEKTVAQSESECSSLKERVAMLEISLSEDKATATEWRHRAERAEQEASLAQKEREAGREQLRIAKEQVASAERTVADRVADLAAFKSQMEADKLNQNRSQNVIADMQKLINQHMEKNQKLTALVEEQKEQTSRLQARVSEFEAAASSGMSVLSYQKELARVSQERDSAKALLSQKTAEAQKMTAMLQSVSERSGKEEADAELQDKYEKLIGVNKKLEKQLTTLEKKNQFLKAQLEKK